MQTSHYRFHGGIHPPENKQQSTRTPIRQAPLPATLIVPLQQHIGTPAKACVAVGERVLAGQLIGRAQGRISANVHAPSSGIVRAIAAHAVPHPSGLSAPCILIDTDGQHEWAACTGLTDYRAISKTELLAFISSKGITGLGGAGFPTDVKLHLGEDHIVTTLIINAAECEPYITADDMLMRERADEIMQGIAIINHLLQPSHILIGIEDNKPQAIAALEQAAHTCDLAIDIRVVPTLYPSGGERQLIKLLTNVEVPSGGIPADIGIVCQNVATVQAVYQAVQFGRPLISRIVTVTGSAVAQPQNMEALIGTPFHTLLQTAGVVPDKMHRLIAGGPMMGFTLDSDTVPVIKTSNCMIAATAEEMPDAAPAQPCIRCGMCEQVCPALLLPQQLHWFAKSREFDKAKQHNLFDCIECGACAYVCPSTIPLVQYYRFAKQEIRSEQAEQRKAELARSRFEARQARLAQEKAEKELRRKARAEQAAKAQVSRQQQSDSGPVTPPPTDDVKKLKTAAAIARTQLKKAQKALASAQEKGLESVAELQTSVDQLQEKAQQAEQALQQAEAKTAPTSPPATASVDDVKKLKTAAAIARTQLKKAQKALASAQEKGLESVAELQTSVDQLQEKAQQTEQALQQAEAKTAPTSPPATPTDQSAPAVLLASEEQIKALKQQLAIARTKLKKTEQALLSAEPGSTAHQQLQTQQQHLTGQLAQAQQQLDQVQGEQHQAAAAQGVDLKQLKIDAALARAAVTKAQRAIDQAKASAQADVAELQQALQDATQRADQLNQTLRQYQ